jgi:hypothetical protein
MYLEALSVRPVRFDHRLCTSGAAFAQPAQPAPPRPPASPPHDDQRRHRRHRAEARENLQNVPISIQALGTQQLEELNVANFQDYTKLTPSVSFQTVQPGTTNVYIRGVASAATATIRARCPRSASISTSSRSPRSAARSTSTSTTSPASRCCAGRRARSTAPRRKPARSASSPTSPIPPISTAAPTAR